MVIGRSKHEIWIFNAKQLNLPETFSFLKKLLRVRFKLMLAKEVLTSSTLFNHLHHHFFLWTVGTGEEIHGLFPQNNHNCLIFILYFSLFYFYFELSSISLSRKKSKY